MLSDTQKKVLKFVATKLKKNNIPFQISGGLAAIAYGAKRPLFDIDIDVHKKDIVKVRELFKQYIIEDFHHLQNEHFDIYVMSLNISGIIIDISQAEECYYIGKDGSKTRIDTDLSKVKVMNIDGIEVLVEDRDELISYKKIIARDTDLIDIEQMSQ